MNKVVTRAPKPTTTEAKLLLPEMEIMNISFIDGIIN